MSNISEKKLTKLWAKSADLDNPRRAEYLNELATALWTMGKNEEAVQVAYTLVDSIDRFSNLEVWFEAKKLLCQCLFAAENFYEAREVISEAIESARLFGTGPTFGILNWFQADNEAKLGNLAAQEALLQIAITEFKANGLDLTEGAARLDLGTALYESGRYEESLQYLTSAVELLENAKAVERVAFTKFKIAKALFDQSRFGMSKKYFEESCALYTFLKREGDVLATRLELGRCSAALLDVEGAKKLFTSAKVDVSSERGQLIAARSIFYHGMMLLGTEQDFEAREMLLGVEPVLRALKLDDLSSAIVDLHL